ncbi:hypothetical protein [Bizionia sp.]|uniref:hypothetical protein n=1 Tax=Bizionia sp. TaxID=1954480 RepID=UPI003A904199
MYKQWLVLTYLENPADFPQASDCLELSVTNHATAHTRNVVTHLKQTLRQTFNLILFLTIFSSCQENKTNGIDIEPVYFEYQNSWEERNLFGKVKSISEFRANFKANDEIDKKNLKSKIQFTDFGGLKRVEYFGTFGDTTQIEQYEYDEKDNFIESNTELVGANRSFKTLTLTDSINNIVTHKSYLNNSIAETNAIYYDENDRIKKRFEIKGNDTIEYVHKLEFDKADNLISEVQIDKSGNEENKIANNFKYDRNGNLIRSSYKVHSTEYISEFKWENDKIISRSDFIIYPDESKHLEESNDYDKYYNPTDYKKFANSKIDQEIKYEYEYDKNGNWIKRTVFLKQNSLGSKKFEKAYIEFREIEYWE